MCPPKPLGCHTEAVRSPGGPAPKPQHPHRSQLVEPGKELIQGHDQFLGGALGRQAGETFNVCKQDAADDGRRWKVSHGPQRCPGPALSLASSCPTLPDIVMLLDVDLVEHHVFFLCVDVFFHLHGNVLGQHGQQQPLLDQWF